MQLMKESLQKMCLWTMRDFREVLARVKDYITVIFKPEPTYLGETILVDGDGNATND